MVSRITDRKNPLQGQTRFKEVVLEIPPAFPQSTPQQIGVKSGFFRFAL